MNTQRLGSSVYLLGLAIMIGDVIHGKQIQAEVALLGITGVQARYGDAGVSKLLLFAFAFPLGVSVSLLGAALFGGTAKSRTGRLGGIALVVVLAPILTSGIFGTKYSPDFFGYGGMSIMVLVAAAMWSWGKYRMHLPDALRPAADWQGLGYLAFALAAWNLCGFGGMPGFAVHPEKMIALDAIPFAVGQLKAVMALFILGWIFTVLGLHRAVQLAAAR